MRRPKPNWKVLRDLLWMRSGGYCEVTGVPLDPETFDAHHRRPKGMGGTDRPDTDLPSNLLALDPDAHNSGRTSVHGRRGWSEEHGYLLPQSTPLAIAWPVKLASGRHVYLLNDGSYRDVPVR